MKRYEIKISVFFNSNTELEAEQRYTEYIKTLVQDPDMSLSSELKEAQL